MPLRRFASCNTQNDTSAHMSTHPVRPPAHRHQSAYPPTSPPTYLSSCLPTRLPVHQHTYQFVCLPAYQSTNILINLSAYPPTSPPTYLSICLPTRQLIHFSLDGPTIRSSVHRPRHSPSACLSVSSPVIVSAHPSARQSTRLPASPHACQSARLPPSLLTHPPINPPTRLVHQSARSLNTSVQPPSYPFTLSSTSQRQSTRQPAGSPSTNHPTRSPVLQLNR